MIMHLVPEGRLDGVAGRRLIRETGHTLGTVYDARSGCCYIRDRAVMFRYLATDCSGVLVLTDFRDAKTACVPEALDSYFYNKVPTLPQSFLCRFAVAELESWLLADYKGLAAFLHITESLMPDEPEGEEFPKRTLVNLARKSRKTDIRQAIVPAPRHESPVAPGYTAAMTDFIENHWNIEAAAVRAPSLRRCVQRLRELA